MIRRLGVLAAIAALLLSISAPFFVSSSFAAGPSPGHGLGYLPTPPSVAAQANRQLAGKLKEGVTSTKLPSSIDLSATLPPIGNQGGQGSCVAWAVAYYYKTFQERAEHQTDIDGSWDVSQSQYEFSPSYVYNQINGGSDNGSYIPDALDLLVSQGVAPLSVFPYDQFDYYTQPDQTVRNAAYPYRSLEKQLLFYGQGAPDLSVLKAQLNQGDPFVLAVPVYVDQYTGQWNDLVDIPDPNTFLAGGHAIAIVGYDDNAQSFKFANSWGTGWGSHNGYGFLTYAFVQGYANEAWAMSDRSGDFQDQDDSRVLLSGSTLNGTISPQPEWDTYYFDGIAGETATVSLHSVGSGLVPDLYLHAPSGGVVARDYATGGSPDAVISSQALSETGRYTVVARSYGSANDGNYALTVTEVADFKLTISPGSRSVKPGEVTTYTVSVNSEAPVDLSLAGLPQAATATFNPNPVGASGDSLLSIETSTSTPPGDYELVVAGTGSGVTRTAKVGLQVSGEIIAEDYQVYLPVVMNDAYGGWTSTAYIQNRSGAPATVSVDYYDTNGVKVKSQTQPVNAHAYWIVSQTAAGLPDGFAGSAIVRSDQPISAIVNEIPQSGDGMSYKGLEQGSPQVYLPVVLNNAYGGWTTGLGLLNVGATPTSVTITYYDPNGHIVGPPSTKSSLAPNAYWAVYQGGKGLPDNFAGSAKITSNQPVVAIVNEINYASTKGGGAMSYTGIPAGGKTLYTPVVMNNAYGGWTTGIGLRNLGNSPASVAITYYDNDGNQMAKKDRGTVAKDGYWGIYQGAGQLPKNFAGSAVITSDQPIVAIANEINYVSTGAMSYNGFAGGSNSIYLPAMMNNYQGMTTGISIKNLGSSSTVTISYYNENGSLVKTENKTVGAGGYWGVYQGAGQLSDGFRGGATISSSQPLVAIVNQISADGKAMSYEGLGE